MELQLRFEERQDGIVVLWLDQPQRSVVVLDQWLLDQLHLFFDHLETRPTPTGFVLMSANDRVFVAGADLAEIDSLDDEQLMAYLTEGADAYGRISSLPCPSVAALGAAALGGGLEIALHCDDLIAARPAEGGRPWKFGLPEAGLGLCPGWGGTQMLTARIDPAEAIRRTSTGALWKIDAPPDGLFARIIGPDEDLCEAAVALIGERGGGRTSHVPVCIDSANATNVHAAVETVRADLPDTPAAHAVVEAVETGVQSGWVEAVAAERRLLVSLRHTDAARVKLEAFFARNA